MGWNPINTFTDLVDDITDVVPAVAVGVGVGLATQNPYAGFAAYKAVSGVKQYETGRELVNAGRRYENEQIGLAQEYADALRAGGQRALDASAAAASAANRAASRQRSMLAAAAEKARAIALMNSKLVITEGQETLRRTKNEHRQTEGTATARSWAGGLLGDRGTLGRFQKSLHKENQRQQNWIVRAFEQQAAVVREGGDLQAALIDAQRAGIVSGGAQIAAQGAAAFSEANLAADQAIAQARLSGDAMIARGKSAKKGGLGNFVTGLGGLYIIGTTTPGTATSGGGGGGI